MHMKLPVKQETALQKLPLRTFVDDFIHSLDTSQKTKSGYRQALERFEQWIVKNKITSPQREDILNYKASLQAEGLAALTVSAYLVAVRRFFAYLEGIKQAVLGGIIMLWTVVRGAFNLPKLAKMFPKTA